LELFEGADERVDVRSGVNPRDEGDFEPAGRGVESMIKHVVEVAGMGLLVAGFGVVEIVDGFSSEEGCEQAAAGGAV